MRILKKMQGSNPYPPFDYIDCIKLNVLLS